MKHFASTRRYQVGECVRVADLGLCRIVRGVYVRGMYHYSAHGLQVACSPAARQECLSGTTLFIY